MYVKHFLYRPFRCHVQKIKCSSLWEKSTAPLWFSKKKWKLYNFVYIRMLCVWLKMWCIATDEACRYKPEKLFRIIVMAWMSVVYIFVLQQHKAYLCTWCFRKVLFVFILHKTVHFCCIDTILGCINRDVDADRKLNVLHGWACCT